MEAINLNLIPSGVLPVCHAKQFDKGRTIRINLFNGTAPLVLAGTETVSINVRKPDKHIVTANLTNTSDSYVEVETTEQMVAVAGTNLCDIKIVDGSDEIGTLNFKMEVQEDPLNGGLASDSEINNLQTQVGTAVATELATQYDSANVLFDAAPTAGHNAPYAVTSEGVKNAISAAVPTKTSDLTNDSGFITSSDIPATYDADDINYDNSLSGLAATDAQAAIDELAGGLPASDVSSSFTLAAGFNLQTWGWIKAYKVGKLVILSFLGIYSSADISSNTKMITGGLTVSGSYIGTCRAGSALVPVISNGNDFEVNDLAANTNASGQMIFFVS